MEFGRLVKYFQKLEETGSRNKMTEILAELFSLASAEEIDKVIYLALGRLGPKFAAVEFQMAEKMAIRAVALALGAGEEEVRKEFKRLGDLGEVYKTHKSYKTYKPHKAGEVYEKLLKIAREAGEGSVERKVKGLAELLKGLDSLGGKYAVRVVLGTMRLGFSEMTILDGLSWMLTGDKSLRPEIERVYNVRADAGLVAKKIKNAMPAGRQEKLKMKNLKTVSGGVSEVSEGPGPGKGQALGRARPRRRPGLFEGMGPEVGTAVVPALCQRLGTAEEMIKKMQNAKCKMQNLVAEPKLDGTRLQIHLGSLGVKIFTRNLENVTAMFPEIVSGVKKLAKEKRVEGLILDGEAVGMERLTGKILAFQEMITRKRKHKVMEAAAAVPIVYYVFDVLYYKDYKEKEDLMREPLWKRRELLEEILEGENKGVLRVIEQKVVRTAEELRDYHHKMIKKGFEGVVVKKIDGKYEPGRRGFNWVKFKTEEGKGGGLGDTIDCLVMGYYYGKGKRTQFGIGAFLAGVRRDEKFVTIAKIGTGLSDEQWRKFRVQGSGFRVQEKPKEYVVDKNLAPDVWIAPGIVAEIAADNITKSPLHTAGVGLRFPRLEKFRDDKGPEEVTTMEEVERIQIT